MPSRSASKKRALRANFDIKASCRYYGLPPIAARVFQLSRTGMQLCVPQQLSLDRYLTVDFDPGVGTDALNPHSTRVSLRGRLVRFIEQCDGGFVYGVAFEPESNTQPALQWAATYKFLG